MPGHALPPAENSSENLAAPQEAVCLPVAAARPAVVNGVVSTAADRFDRWAFTEFALPVRSLALFRILFAGTLLLIVVPRGLSVHRLPEMFYHTPFSVAMFWTAPVSAEVMQALNLGLIVALAALLLGWRTRVASVSVCTLLVLLQSFMYATGKINHGHLLLTLVPGVLAWSSWGRDLSIDSRGSGESVPDLYREAWSISLLAFLVAVAMFTAGWPKLTTGWLDLSSQATNGHLMVSYVSAGHHTWAGALALRHFPAWLWECMDWATVLMECGFLLVLWNRRLFRLFCAVACLFHLGVLLIFDINFYGNLAAYAAFVDWQRLPVPGLVRAFSRRCGRLLASVPPLLLLTVVTATFACTGLFLRRSIVRMLEIPVSPVLITTGAVVAAVYIGHELWQVVRRQPAAATFPLDSAAPAEAVTLRKSA